jgi:hypothetical protein
VRCERDRRANGNRFKEKGFVFLALNPGWVNTDLAGEGMGNYVSCLVCSNGLDMTDCL